MVSPLIGPDGSPTVVEPTEPIDRLLRDLRTGRRGLSTREAARRLIVYGPNELRRQGGTEWWRDLALQFTHPLAMLLWAAAALAALSGTGVLAEGIVAVIVLNALFAFGQERQAERAVEALGRYLSQRATVLRDERRVEIDASAVVPGDVILLEAGDRVPADARLLEGDLEVDLSTLTGESLPLLRSATADSRGPLLEARDVVFSGTVCTGGDATAVVFATGMRTELGRIAALSQRTKREESPLEQQVKRVAWLIAMVSVGVGLVFVPLGIFGAGLSLHDAGLFAIGLIVANVPEGLLPTITLALAIGVRTLSRSAALVKRLSAVETLGCTTVICTDKTGTLTENRMKVTRLWTHFGVAGSPLDSEALRRDVARPLLSALGETLARCSNAALPDEGDPTELALLELAVAAGSTVGPDERDRQRRRQFHFDPALRLMSTVDQTDGGLVLHAKGATEALLPQCSAVVDVDGRQQPLTQGQAVAILAEEERLSSLGLRVLALACRPLTEEPESREKAELELSFLGLVAMVDPPRPEVPAAAARCLRSGIRIIVVTGDAPHTAEAVARQVGIVGSSPRVLTGAELDEMSEGQLDDLLREETELIFARSSPETKLRITDALRDEGHVVAMTGDGVNDAPALRRSDIGVAMGRSGTDVAREAATMVLTDDNFASIVTAIEAGRRVYDNVRKFILYIFAHATPEVLPFMVFALSGGAVPLPLTVMQILAIDLGTETLPALALGREPAEAGIMDRPPRPRGEGVIRPQMLIRAWVYLGLTSATLVMAGFLWVLLSAGWHPGDAVGTGSALHHAYRQATTMTFAGIVACQIGTAFASRTEHVSLRSVGLLGNPLLLWGIAFEMAFAALLIYTPLLHSVFGTEGLTAAQVGLLATFPPIVWGVDELRRARVRHRQAGDLVDK